MIHPKNQNFTKRISVILPEKFPIIHWSTKEKTRFATGFIDFVTELRRVSSFPPQTSSNLGVFDV